MCNCKALQEIQLLREHLSFLQNFIITKYLKQKIDNLSIFVDEHSSCGLSNWRDKDLLKSCDQKVMTLLPPIEKCPIVFYHRVAFAA